MRRLVAVVLATALLPLGNLGFAETPVRQTLDQTKEIQKKLHDLAGPGAIILSGAALTSGLMATVLNAYSKKLASQNWAQIPEYLARSARNAMWVGIGLGVLAAASAIYLWLGPDGDEETVTNDDVVQNRLNCLLKYDLTGIDFDDPTDLSRVPAQAVLLAGDPAIQEMVKRVHEGLDDLEPVELPVDSSVQSR